MKKILTIFLAVILFLGFALKNCNDNKAKGEYCDNENLVSLPGDTIGHKVTMNVPEEDTAVVDGTDRDSCIEIPRLLKNKPEQILLRKGYTTSYNGFTKNANWVAWHLTKEHTNGPYSRDGIDYLVDMDVDDGERAELDDWYGHGLPIDHGHLCPAGDNKWDEDAMIESFYLTNMCPQNSQLNRGDWEELEDRCRGWARHYGEIFIVAGPIFYNDKYSVIGENSIAVPQGFFKVVLRLGKKPMALGFIYPNESVNNKMSSYVRTVDEVEEITGIDFFYNLPDDVEEAVESKSEFNKW